MCFSHTFGLDCNVFNVAIECSSSNNETLAADWNMSNILSLETCPDNINATITSDYDFNNLSINCGQSGDITVTYVIADNSGNFNTLTATLFLDDTTTPIWNNLPSDQTVGCDVDYQVTYETWLESFSGTDTCGTTILNHDAPLTISCPQSVLVNFELSDSCGNTTIASATFEVDDTFSVSEVETMSLEMYPNPTHNTINFKGIKENSEVEIFNILGEKVLHSSINNSVELQLNLNSGLYLVKIISEYKTTIKKLIIK
ncbi:T9SS type A sorting domain-containing protein [Psychroserpens sp.]|uniref:T9SS type A sorting domain-containing protein n=1 Tax=Psychroserpens sp. TaxID=2020870 RepID=UPI003865A77B